MSTRVNMRCSCGRVLIDIGEKFDDWISRGCSEAEALANINEDLAKRKRATVERLCCVCHLMCDTDVNPNVTSFAPSRGEQSTQSQPQQSAAWQVGSGWSQESYNFETMSQDDSGMNNWE